MSAVRSDVVGSLLRPDELKDARARLEAGTLAPAGFKTLEDRAVTVRDRDSMEQDRVPIDRVVDHIRETLGF